MNVGHYRATLDGRGEFTFLDSDKPLKDLTYMALDDHVLKLINKKNVEHTSELKNAFRSMLLELKKEFSVIKKIVTKLDSDVKKLKLRREFKKLDQNIVQK